MRFEFTERLKNETFSLFSENYNLEKTFKVYNNEIQEINAFIYSFSV